MHDCLRWVVPLGLTLAAVATDLRWREVPDALPVALIVWAVIACGAGMGVTPSWLTLAAGAFLGLAASVPFFAVGGWGGGDVKLLVALGTNLGPLPLLKMMVWMGLAGGILALISAARGRRDFAYVPAIAAGLCVQLAWPDAIENLFLRSL